MASIDTLRLNDKKQQKEKNNVYQGIFKSQIEQSNKWNFPRRTTEMETVFYPLLKHMISYTQKK